MLMIFSNTLIFVYIFVVMVVNFIMLRVFFLLFSDNKPEIVNNFKRSNSSVITIRFLFVGKNLLPLMYCDYQVDGSFLLLLQDSFKVIVCNSSSRFYNS